MNRSIESHNREPFGHTFHIVKENAGFLWLGVRLQVIEQGEVVGEATVYGDTLHAIRLHEDAEVRELALRIANSSRLEDAIQDVLNTNNNLPERFQRQHPAKPEAEHT